MKKFVLTAVIAALSASAGAQVYIGGGIRFWDNNDDKRTTISFTPEVGYRASKRFAFGAQLGYEYSKENGSRSNIYSATPYLRHYLYTSNGLEIFWNAMLEFCYIDPSKGRSGYCLGIGASPGISYKLSRHFSVSAYLGFIGYRHREREVPHPRHEPGLGLSFSNDLSFNFHYHF